MTLSVRSPDELIAVIPHLLGFKPEESLVFLPMSSELPASRVDLPNAPHDREVVSSSIRDAYGRHAQPDSSVAIVCVTGVRGTATDIGHEFAARFADVGIDTRVMLWADETRWADLDTGDGLARDWRQPLSRSGRRWRPRSTSRRNLTIRSSTYACR